ncbi:MAG: hypothetical protein ACOC6G_01395 [Thermoproteota archaeon]
MEKINKVVCVIFLLAIFVILEEVSIVQSSISTAQNNALTFMEDVLPVDFSRYSLTLRNYGVPELPDLGSYQHDDDKREILTYDLESKESSVDVILTFNNGLLYMCQVSAREGSVINDKSYSSTVNAAKSFLEKYQVYSGMDSSEMVAMLSGVDPTENTTRISGNLKLIITHKDLSDTAFGDVINFRWVRVINGCEYLATGVTFRDGDFSSFIDQRARYSIGNTTVKISKDQAIEIAMEHIQNYSYRMADNLVISDFNITESRTTATLKPTVREDNVLYPHWSITLYLNQTYPGSVTSLLLGIWADSGEVFLCHHQAYGGSDLILDDNSDYELPTSTPPSTETPDEGSNESTVNDSAEDPSNDSSSTTSTPVLVIASVVSATVLLGAAIYTKKRKH